MIFSIFIMLCSIGLAAYVTIFKQPAKHDSLSKANRTNVVENFSLGLIKHIYLFDGLPKDLVIPLVSDVNVEELPPGEVFMLQNEIPKYLYIIAAGEVEMSYTCPYGYSVIIGTCAKGDVCGDIGVLLHRLQPFEFRTRTSCTLLRLDAKTFLDIVRDFVEDPSIILSNLLKHLKDQDLMKEYLTVTDDEGKLRRGRMKRPLPLSLHNIISRDDDSLLYQLLAWGFDPNESNKNGETALHIAASTGSVPCVVLLLKYRANPYIRDFDGRTAYEIRSQGVKWGNIWNNRGLKRLVPRNTRRH